MKATPTHQHYVPQFVLRNFATGRSKQIYVFDKSTGKAFKTAVRNIASESGFYDIEINGSPSSLDPALQKLEDSTKEVIRKIIQARSVRGLNTDDASRIIEPPALVVTTSAGDLQHSLPGVRDLIRTLVRSCPIHCSATPEGAST